MELPDDVIVRQSPPSWVKQHPHAVILVKHSATGAWMWARNDRDAQRCAWLLERQRCEDGLTQAQYDQWRRCMIGRDPAVLAEIVAGTHHWADVLRSVLRAWHREQSYADTWQPERRSVD